MRAQFGRQFSRQFGGQSGGGFWWLAMAPGLLLTLMALAILIWPELLAYMIASVMLFGGVSLLGWSMRRLSKRTQADDVIYYREGEPGQRLL